MTSYAHLSKIYDQWQENNDDLKWADYIEKIVLRHCAKNKGDGTDNSLLLLDLGCGTGGVAIEMAKRGYDVLGVDQSSDMLAVAKEKESADKVQFIQQDITRMELFGTVDIMICLLDTVNHILDEKKLTRFFSLCKKYLNPNGLLIFDIATPHYFEKVLGNQLFYDIKENYTLLWQNHVDIKKSKNSSELIFFIQQDDGSYLRGEDLIKEKIYNVETIENIINTNGLNVLKKYGELSFQKPSINSKRVFFVVENSQDEWKNKLGNTAIGKRRKVLKP